MGLLDNNVVSKTITVTESLSTTGELYRFDNSAHKYNALRIYGNYIMADNRISIDFRDAYSTRQIYSANGEVGLLWGNQNPRTNIVSPVIYVDISGCDYVILNNINSVSESRTFIITPLVDIPDSIVVSKPRQIIGTIDYEFTEGDTNVSIETDIPAQILTKFKYIQLFYTSAKNSSPKGLTGDIYIRGYADSGLASLSNIVDTIAIQAASYRGASDWIELSAISRLDIVCNLSIAAESGQQIRLKLVGIR